MTEVVGFKVYFWFIHQILKCKLSSKCLATNLKISNPMSYGRDKDDVSKSFKRLGWVTTTSRFDLGSGPDQDPTYQWDTKRDLFTWRRYALS